MGQSQEEPKEKNALNPERTAGSSQEERPEAAPVETPPPPEEKRPPVGPPTGTVARLMLTWRLVLALLLAVAALNTVLSLYDSQELRWPTSPASLLSKTQTMIERGQPYVEGLRHHIREVFKPHRDIEPHVIGLHDRLILALAILAFIIRLLMESKLVGETLALSGPSRWEGSNLYSFELLAAVGLGGLLMWLGAAMKTNDQISLLWIFVAYLVAHGVWMALNFVLVEGGKTEGISKFLGLGINSLACAAVLIAGSFFTKYLRAEIKVVTAASLVCLASSVIGLRIVADSFFGGDRPRKVLRHAAFTIICLLLLALVTLVILARW